MANQLIHGPTPPADRRGQIAHAAGLVCRDRREAATRDLRNKLRIAYRVPYHEWERALAGGAGQITALLERYGAAHWPQSVAVPGGEAAPLPA